MTFTDHCKQNNIQIMRDDIAFIRKMVKRLSPELRKRVIRRYLDEWVLGRDGCEIVALSQNSGRRRANLYMLDTIEGLN